ncbi:SDR family NAD(P)-dependent oxidoreductase [Bacillus thuringiensis]|uniref:SDR family NAD(P)-dependent oxidoreductase n=1 Tax=Bacillus thuringiensis TaxID=1428 RepID=UPI000CD8EA7A|nr:SDR family NAD(P)-dependent oxidoreductase [Bacillus thuringiensis]QFQ28773.1 SDR family NAD(P)-dependent oxidoreductase [Bacillus thuringiensis]
MKVVVITGTNRGLGYGIAKSFADKGYKVIGLNRTLCKESWLEEIQCDITKRNEIEKAINQIIKRFGQIDIIVNNAGIRRFDNITKMTEQDWQDSITTNLSAPLWLIQYTAKWLKQTNGLIVFVGSHASEYYFEQGVAYSSTKSALRAMAETAIQDLRHEGIRVSYLSLGAIANRPMENDEWKMLPSDIGQLVVGLAELPLRVVPAFVEVRPLNPNKSPILGLERLQYI